MSPRRPEYQSQRLGSELSILPKPQRSHRSFATSSFEANDEQSSSNGEMSSRGGTDSDLRRLGMPAYEGHDARPTSQKELWGWYMYAFASETYVICAMSSFIPILIETLARENGVLLSNPDKPCGSSDSKNGGDGQCVLYLLGMQINTASFTMYTFSLSVLVQALLVVSISCAADHGNYRKKLLLGFAWVGSFAVMGFIFVNKTTYLLGALLTIISNTSFGTSFVLLNSFLPLLVRNHPELNQAATPETSDPAEDLETSMASSTSALISPEDEPLGHGLKRVATHEETISKELQLSTRISATGIGIGYGAALIVQCISIGVLMAMGNSTWAQRVVLLGIGTWWAVFTIPAARWLRPRPGPPLAINGQKEGVSWWSYLKYAWKSLFRTIQWARRLLDIMLFLAGWFLLSDAIATTSSTAIMFAKTQLHMKPWALGLINVISTLAGVCGAFGWPRISRAFKLQPHQTILVCIALFELVPLYGLMGYLPFVQRWGVLGLQQSWEMFPLAALYGFVLGGISGYCRSLFGELIPPGSEAAFYALYAITDKGSSVFGPVIVGSIIDRTGSIRPAFWFIGVLFGLPAPLIWLINVERGKREGEALAETIKGFEGTSHEEASGDDDDNDDETRGMLADYEASGEGNGQASHRRG